MSARVGAAALALAAVLAGGPAPAPAAAPRIRFDALACDLGSLVQGERPACSFAFRNAGDADLEVLGLEPACGCTSALLAQPRIPPGGAGSVSVTFDSGDFSGDVAKQIAVRSNDPLAPELVLTLRAHVEPEVELEPREVVFDPGRGSAASETVVLVNRRAEAVHVRALAAAPASFSCRIPSWPDTASPLRVESWERVPVEVVYAPPAPPVMPVAGRCTLTVAGPRKTEFELKLLALPR